MSAILEKINAELAAFNEKKKALTDQLRAEFPSLFTDLFANSKKISSFSWTQYTPYFNDGESCTFGVNNSDIKVNGKGEYDDDEDGEGNFLQELIYTRNSMNNGYKSSPNPVYDAAEVAIVKQIEEILCSIPDEFYEELFGDHVEVTVHRDGKIEVDEYSHD